MLELNGENPPVAIVPKAWQMASKRDIPQIKYKRKIKNVIKT